MKNKLSVEIRAVGKALLLSFVLSSILASVVYFTNLQETLLPLLGNIVLILTVFLTGCSVSKTYGTRGLIRGISIGIAFFIMMIIATLALGTGSIKMSSFFFNLLICIAAGGLGGILGIGLSDAA